jgi:hypothetical protein
MNGWFSMSRKKVTCMLSVTSIMMLLLVSLPIGISESIAETKLDITLIKGGIGKVTVDVKNIGTEVAEDIKISIGVNGGFLGRINLLQVCSGCGQCGTTLDPDAIKSESTSEAGFIMGFGPIAVNVTASASNAPEIEMETTGFVIGPLVLIQ